jgi:hypothetical protein
MPNCVGEVDILFPLAKMHDSTAAPPELGPTFKPMPLSAALGAPLVLNRNVPFAPVPKKYLMIPWYPQENPVWLKSMEHELVLKVLANLTQTPFPLAYVPRCTPATLALLIIAPHAIRQLSAPVVWAGGHTRSPEDDMEHESV